jgi:prephenate dehydrogenase
VLVPDPGYPTYAAVTSLVGGIARAYRLREDRSWGIDLDALESSDLSRVKVMWINFPHMPTGRVATREELERLVRLARRNRFLLASDNPYAMIGSPSPLSVLSIDGAKEVSIELGSLSKSHNMAGWRVGWVAGRREHVDLVLRVRSNMDSGTFLPIQLAAATALESRSNWFDTLDATYAARRRETEAVARALGCTFDDGQAGLFVWARVPDNIVDVEEWLDAILRETKVFVTPGFVFGEAGRRHVRISLCNPVEVMREARERLEAFVGRANSALRAPLSAPRTPHPAPQSAIRNPQFNVTIIGLGLIGGSIAIDLRERGLASRIVGVDANPENADVALARGLVDEVASLERALPDSDVVVLAVPVDAIEELAPAVLDAIGEHAVVVDTGSTKRGVCEAVAGHPRRDRFVAAHPIAGTENSGPSAALSGLFREKVNIVCERERTADSAIDTALALFDALGLRTTFMGPREHDLHLAYVSHLSHVTSFVLGQTVLDIENDEANIFLLAGSGFASTVRLAKSSPSMWAPIFDGNTPFLAKALDEYIAHLQRFRQALGDRDVDRLRAIMTEANEIRRVLDNMEGSRSADGSSAGARAASPSLESALLATGDLS